MEDIDSTKYNRGYSEPKRVLLLLCLVLAGLQPAPVLSSEESEVSSEPEDDDDGLQPAPVLSSEESEVSSEPEDDDDDGLEVNISGPDHVTVGVPCSFDCEASCVSSCTYSMSVDGQTATGQGSVLAFTVKQWVEAITLTCAATDDDTGASNTITKNLQVLAGPANISITGPDLMNPTVSHSYSCHAYCRPFCNYSWQINKGPWIGGQGNVISVTAQETDISKNITCRATNSVSGLYVTAIRSIAVPSGPSQVHIGGPDTVEAAIKSKFVCTAECTPSCRYLWHVDSQTVKGSGIELTVERPLKSVTVKCEAQNTVSRKSATVLKTVWMGEATHSRSTRPERTSALLLFGFIVSKVMSL